MQFVANELWINARGQLQRTELSRLAVTSTGLSTLDFSVCLTLDRRLFRLFVPKSDLLVPAPKLNMVALLGCRESRTGLRSGWTFGEAKKKISTRIAGREKKYDTAKLVTSRRVAVTTESGGTVWTNQLDVEIGKLQPGMMMFIEWGVVDAEAV